MSAVDDLTEFLLARVEEDYVKRVTMREWHAEDCDQIPSPCSEYTYPCDCGVPERMALECEAKRRIVDRCAALVDELDDFPNGLVSPRAVLARTTLALLALPYADHPDFDEAWRP
jgi:hypothetical protein